MVALEEEDSGNDEAPEAEAIEAIAEGSAPISAIEGEAPIIPSICCGIGVGLPLVFGAKGDEGLPAALAPLIASGTTLAKANLSLCSTK